MKCVACDRDHTDPDVRVFIALPKNGICDQCVFDCWGVLAERANQERKIAPLKNSKTGPNTRRA